MAILNSIKLNDNVAIPVYGFGTFQIPADGSTYKAVLEALKLGIRHIDTAVAYFNEEEVGRAVKDSGIPREEIFITSKLWLQDYGYEPAKKAIELSLKKLGGTYIDLYLLHQPYGEVEELTGAWKAMEEAKDAGKIRSIGVSNMTVKLWNKYIPHFSSMPSVNQVEWNPYFQQKELMKLMKENNVAVESWGPLAQGNKELFTEPVIKKIAEAHGKNVGQVILRFEIQEGIIVFPKSTKQERIKSNMDIFDFELTEEEMNEMRALDKGHGSHDPDAPGIGEMLKKYDVHVND